MKTPASGKDHDAFSFPRPRGLPAKSIVDSTWNRPLNGN